MLYRVYYANGFWGDEVAKNKRAALESGKLLAKANATTVLKVEVVRAKRYSGD
jgi:hypothetical protein